MNKKKELPEIVLIGLSHKPAPVEFREDFSFDDETVDKILESASVESIKEIVYLSTCNRVEIYFISRDLKEAVDTVIITVFDQNTIIAKAGNDTTVKVNSQYTLQGSFVGNVTTTSWKIGTGPFFQAQPKHTITTPSQPTSLMCIFKVQDANMQVDLDTVIITVINQNKIGINISKGYK